MARASDVEQLRNNSCNSVEMRWATRTLHSKSELVDMNRAEGRFWVHLVSTWREHDIGTRFFSEFQIAVKWSWVGTQVFAFTELQWIHKDRESNDIAISGGRTKQ
jgi:hypothetical protein